ncbi:unnamed protein product, partial [Laminaria digitata]
SREHKEAACCTPERQVFPMEKDLAFASACCTRSGLSTSWAPVLPRAMPVAAAAAAARGFDHRPHRTATAAVAAIDRGHHRHTTTLLLLAASSPGLTRGIASMALKGRRLKRPRWSSLFKRSMPHRQATAVAPSTAPAQA